MPFIAMPDEVFVIRGKTINSETGKPIDAKIIYERLSDGRQVGTTRSNRETGEYEIVLPVGEYYGFRAEAEGYLAISENIDLRNKDQKYEEITQDLKLAPIIVEVSIVMNNVFFEFNKGVINSESMPELNRITDFLTKNGNIKISIDGHSDSSGPGVYNMELSQRRAQSVRNYFISKGVDQERMDLKFFGELEPVDTNETMEGRRKNRRVEFTIVEK
jgi:outer membrane protein OmpA-like peptidoglycan-associated protein